RGARAAARSSTATTSPTCASPWACTTTCSISARTAICSPRAREARRARAPAVRRRPPRRADGPANARHPAPERLRFVLERRALAGTRPNEVLFEALRKPGGDFAARSFPAREKTHRVRIHTTHRQGVPGPLPL